MASSGGHNFVDYTMHSCKRSILGTGQGIVCILIMGYCHSFYRLLWKKKKKKIFFAQTWRGSFFSRLWFILPYHAGDPARYNRTTIYYTLQDRSMGKTRDLSSFSSTNSKFFLRAKTIGDLVAQGLLLWLLFRRQCYYPERQEIREEEKLVVFYRVESEISFWIVWKRGLFVRCLF